MKVNDSAPFEVDVFAKVIYKNGKTKDLGLVYTDKKGFVGMLVRLREKWRRIVWSLLKGYRS